MNTTPPCPQPQEKNETTSFESAFMRLEEILERMNSNSISLDDSLKLFKEADSLISICSKKLNSAEREVEMLIKNRQGDIALGQDQKPMTQNFDFSNPPF